MPEVSPTTALWLWSTQYHCYCNEAPIRLEVLLGRGFDEHLADRGVINLSRMCMCPEWHQQWLALFPLISLFFMPVMCQAGLIFPESESCESPKWNIYPNFWLLAKHMLSFIFHMVLRRQTTLSERCTFNC